MSSDWRELKLSELTSKITKGTTPSKKDGGFSLSGVNYIKAESVGYDGTIDESKFAFITQDVHEKLKRSQLEAGDILFSMAGVFLGKSALVEDRHIPANTNQALALIRPKHREVDAKYLRYFLSQPSIIHFVNNATSQSAQPNINLKQIGDLKISVPALPVQRSISSALSSLDDKITLNTQTNQTLEQMAQALFKSWFVDFDPVIDNALDSGFFDQLAAGDGIPEPLAARVAIRQAVREGMRQALRQTMTEGARAATGAAAASQEPSAINASFSASLPADIRALFPASFVEHPDLGWIPEGWAVKTLAELAEKISKGTTPNKTDLSQAKDEPTVRFLKVKDMGDDGEIDISNLELISRSIHEGGLKRSILQRGDLLFSIAGTIGRVGQVTEELHDSNTNQAVAFIRLKDAQSHQEFVRQNLLSPRIQSDVTAKVVQGVQANVSLKSIGELAVCVPSVELLNVWNSSAFPLIRQIELQRRQSSSLANLRDTLLPKLLSGELTLAEA
ncbi:restriction endonuclease subunit S [Shewanella algae]|uniref:restriction endonuclease subunit S n=1 Tax=Shewanella algae TaxID=38313 RepID=UPI00313CDB69